MMALIHNRFSLGVSLQSSTYSPAAFYTTTISTAMPCRIRTETSAGCGNYRRRMVARRRRIKEEQAAHSRSSRTFVTIVALRRLLYSLCSMIPRFIFAITILALGVAVWAAGGLTAKQARDLLRKLGGAELKPEQVRIKTVSGGIGANAIVEANIETAVRFKQEKGEWKITDIRLGNHHWESVELITEAIRREKIRRTEELLQKIAKALAAHKEERGAYVVAEDFDKLLDQLAPQYLPTPFRFDLWEQPLLYRGTPSEYRLSSSGPDLKAGTGDDLIMEQR
jgi:hypothetical protein